MKQKGYKKNCRQNKFLSNKHQKQLCSSRKRRQACSAFRHPTLHVPVEKTKLPRAVFFTEVWPTDRFVKLANSQANIEYNISSEISARKRNSVN